MFDIVTQISNPRARIATHVQIARVMFVVCVDRRGKPLRFMLP